MGRTRCGELANLSRLQSCDRQSIAKQNAIRRECSNARSWRENALQIQWIGSTKRNQFALRRCLADGTQQADGFGQCELLTAGSTDKIAATNLTARFPPAINSSQLVPGNRKTLAVEQTAKHNAITTQQYARKFLDGKIGRRRIGAVRRWPARRTRFERRLKMRLSNLFESKPASPGDFRAGRAQSDLFAAARMRARSAFAARSDVPSQCDRKNKDDRAIRDRNRRRAR